MKWHLETRKISSLKDHPKNPRVLTKEQADQLQKSLEKFGLIDKPIINPDGLIIGGHQRKNILKKLAIKEVECWVPDRELTEKEIDELNIRLNRSGEFDWDSLANNYEIPELKEWGFSENELLGATQDTNEEKINEEIHKCPTCGKKMRKKIEG